MQSTEKIRNRPLFARILFLGLSLFTHFSIAQTKTITLKSERLKVSSAAFFIAEVQLKNVNQSNIGKIYDGIQFVSVGLEGGTATAVGKFLSRNFNAINTDTLTPIYLIINELSVEEKVESSRRINGKVTLKLSFDTYRNAQPITLTSGNATSGYVRSSNKEPELETIIRKMIEAQLMGFKKWFVGSKNSVLLAKHVQLTMLADSTTKDDSDTLYYSKKRPLVWKDFRGAGRFGSRWAAQVYTSFGFGMKASTSNRVVQLHISIGVWLDKTSSWVRPDAKNDYTLAHEQLHFDITKLVAEKFRKKIVETTFSVDDFSSEIQYQYLEYYRLLTQTQAQYDDETRHGLDSTAQQRWILKIKDELAALGVR